MKTLFWLDIFNISSDDCFFELWNPSKRTIAKKWYTNTLIQTISLDEGNPCKTSQWNTWGNWKFCLTEPWHVQPKNEMIAFLLRRRRHSWNLQSSYSKNQITSTILDSWCHSFILSRILILKLRIAYAFCRR